MNVLLVDDETNVQQIVGGFLERYASERSLPVSINALCDPIQGLFEATANGELYDIIMLDVRMPKLTGDEIYNSLRHVSPDLLARVLFITGFSDDLRDRFTSEALRVLHKPFRYQQLVEHIEAIVKAD
jgi:DNA-binding response OmpR family regulator